MKAEKNICVFCSSSSALDAKYFDLARDMGREIARAGWSLVFGGTDSGLMKAVADSAHASGAHVTGVVPDSLTELGVASSVSVDDFVRTGCLAERKTVMIELSDAFVALPGGFGTMDEILDVLTLRLLRRHSKPMVLVNADGFYDELLAMFEKFYEGGFAKPLCRALYSTAANAAGAVESIRAHKPESGDTRWF